MNILGVEYQIDLHEGDPATSKMLFGEESLVKEASVKSLSAFESKKCDWGVSMEGGFCEILGNIYLMCVVCIRTEMGTFVGLSSKVRLPQEIESAVKRGVWIGEILDKYQDKNEKKEYTNELCQIIRTRRELFTQALSNAVLFLRHSEELESK